jgi:hypothetical protein
VQAAVAIGGFMAYLAEVGAERDVNEQTKTRWALGYHAAKLVGAKSATARRRPAKAAATRAAAAPLARHPATAPSKRAAAPTKLQP